MKKQYLLGFLLLLTSTIGMLPGSVYANDAIDTDGDGVPNNVDRCPHLLEDYDPQYGNNVDGCPDTAPEQQRFVHDDDLDDIINDEDLCPLDPEDYDGDRDTDGCPDP